jgi:hypothetical protein
MGTAALRTRSDLQDQACTPSRSDVLTRYRHLREISKRHNSAVMSFLSSETVLCHARRLGLATGRTFVLDSIDEMTLVFDLAIHTAPAGRSRAIDRYARSTSFPKGSDQAAVVEAMCNACFAIIVVKERHPAAGLLVTDVFRETDFWLVDEGLELSLSEEEPYVTRYYRPDDFAMTAGVGMPFDVSLLEAAGAMVSQLKSEPPAEMIGDRRFAEAIYRVALADGGMERVSYQDPSGDIV